MLETGLSYPFQDPTFIHIKNNNNNWTLLLCGMGKK